MKLIGTLALALTVLAGLAPPPVLAQSRGAQAVTQVRVFEGAG